MNIVGQLESQHSKSAIPALRAGETVRVHVKVVEGEKERTQVFEGIVIGISGAGNRATFTVRKISYGVGVERVFAINSPNIDRVELVTRGKVRQSRLYFLRDLSGKAARIKERSAAESKQADADAAALNEDDSPSLGASTKGKKRGAHRKAEARTRAEAATDKAPKKARKPRGKKPAAKAEKSAQAES